MEYIVIGVCIIAIVAISARPITGWAARSVPTIRLRPEICMTLC